MDQERTDVSHLVISVIFAALLAWPEIAKTLRRVLAGEPLVMPEPAGLEQIAERLKAVTGSCDRLKALLKEMAGEDAEGVGVPDLEEC